MLLLEQKCLCFIQKKKKEKKGGARGDFTTLWLLLALSQNYLSPTSAENPENYMSCPEGHGTR